MRVAIGGISHESSTFSAVPTTLDDFAQRSLVEGPALVEQYRGTRTCLGGFLDAGRDLAFTVVPTLMATAVPGGPVTAEAAMELTRRLCEGLRWAMQERPLDGVLLALHGAMVSELDDDGERYVLRRVREVIGPEIPIVVTLDLHGNISPEMVELVSIAVAYDEYPHTDTWQRGYEAGILLARIVRGGVRPASTLVKIPLLAGLQRQYTHAEPMLGIKHLARDLENESGILNVSYLPGFPWADIPFTSFSVIVTAEGDQRRAHQAACRLAQEVWNRREQFAVRPVPVDEAVRRAMAADGGPVVLADIGDNPGGGAPADGTVLLEALLRHGAKRAALAAIRDPEVVERARQAGEGAELEVTLGGKTDDRHGRPLPIRGRVVRLSEGRFTHTGPMSTGMTVDLGPTAVLELQGEQDGRVLVVVTTHRYQPTDLGVFRSQGIEPTAQQVLAVKSSVHFRAAFGPIAHEVLEVDTPGITNPRLDPAAYQKLARPIYPFDRDLDWRIDL